MLVSVFRHRPSDLRLFERVMGVDEGLVAGEPVETAAICPGHHEHSF